MDQKTYLRGLKMVQYGLNENTIFLSSKCFFSLCNMQSNIKNQPRSSDLSLRNEKVRLSKGFSTTKFRHAYIMDYATEDNLKN